MPARQAQWGPLFPCIIRRQVPISVALSTGTRLGPYEYSALGAGGMGEDCKALSTRTASSGSGTLSSPRSSHPLLRSRRAR